jgi:hypothetical protein
VGHQLYGEEGESGYKQLAERLNDVRIAQSAIIIILFYFYSGGCVKQIEDGTSGILAQALSQIFYPPMRLR